jgi:hypothetical protein
MRAVQQYQRWSQCNIQWKQRMSYDQRPGQAEAARGGLILWKCDTLAVVGSMLQLGILTA